MSASLVSAPPRVNIHIRGETETPPATAAPVAAIFICPSDVHIREAETPPSTPPSPRSLPPLSALSQSLSRGYASLDYEPAGPPPTHTPSTHPCARALSVGVAGAVGRYAATASLSLSLSPPSSRRGRSRPLLEREQPAAAEAHAPRSRWRPPVAETQACIRAFQVSRACIRVAFRVSQAMRGLGEARAASRLAGPDESRRRVGLAG